ncbi:pentatricopeptide repeat-containing protein MRL1, chloroplastic isoform X1 [Coffea arabica]|uniref:Pentatricopeptide repeat-containing protein MRL1, chloroplastic isoform X1 n=1 Tax=Coffea arabica TaxID=13443 RepID=A0A6P6W9H8_COFAR|nr:pentatricopeptide repeat-containing protein MRL1, chloroplastic [Coffea arabica]
MELSLSSSISSPFSSFRSPGCHCAPLLRKEFLGSGHNLRPPGLRFRRQCRKLGFRFHFHSRNFLLRASLDSHSVVLVVAVTAVAVSAFILVFHSYSKRRNNAQHNQMPGRLTHPLFQHIKSRMDSLSMEEFILLNRNIPIDKKVDLPIEMSNNTFHHEDVVAEMHLDDINVMNGATIATNTSELSICEMTASVVNDSLHTRESEGLSVSSLPLLPSEPEVAGPTLNIEPSEMQLERCEHESGSDSKETKLLLVKKPHIASFFPVNVQSRVTEFGRLDHEILTEGQQIKPDLSHREDLYTFYEAPMAKLNGLGALSSGISLHKNGNSSLFKASVVDGEQFLRQQLSHRAEETEGHEKRHVSYYNNGSSHWKEDMGKRKESPAYKDNAKLHENRSKSLSPTHNLKGKHMHDRNRSPQLFGGYSKLLRDGRLNDCIEMLEDMESKGLLDMDKVYHAGFFKACKTQKAVKEAFRFTKLIPNPTLSTFNMLMSVCASAQDSEGAFEVLQLVQEARLKADCKLYTTLISTCARAGKVDTMFKVFHEMVNAGVEPNVHTYGALIDGCAKAGQVAKAFGAYGIMQSKNVKPDRVVFNALITACGESGAVDRAFDVLAEMRSEIRPIDPDHITVGALIKACIRSGQIDRAREVYKMLDEYNIKGTPEVYTIAVNSQNADWEFACAVYSDMTIRGVAPDEMFISALIDVAGHAGNLDAAFEILKVARANGIPSGSISYSSLMGACSNAKDWQKALQLYEDIKDINLKPTVSMMNALVTALCEADQLQKATEVLFEMKMRGLCPNTITYSILLVASEKKDDLEVGLMLFSQAKKDGVAPNLVMCRCLIGMCLRRFQQACALGEPVFSLKSGYLQLDSKWTSLALMVYREAVVAGVAPTVDELSQVLGCLQLPHDVSLRNRLIENLGVSTDTSKGSKLFSLVDGFGEYDPRAFSLLEEAASLGIVPAVSLKRSPIIVDVRNLPIHAAEVYILTVLKGLKHRLAAGVKLPNLSILLPLEKTQIQTPSGEKTIKVAGRISQAVAALLRRLGLHFVGNESHGKVRINGGAVKKWFQPKLDSPFSGKPTDRSSFQRRLGKGIMYQQRNIRTGDLSLD